MLTPGNTLDSSKIPLSGEKPLLARDFFHLTYLPFAPSDCVAIVSRDHPLSKDRPRRVVTRRGDGELGITPLMPMIAIGSLNNSSLPVG